MIRNRYVLKSIAAFFTLLTINNLFLPSVSYALTAGPTAPEYTSFEPVDTTDMVNLATGDFTYNIPLLEVPGPEGGYPLSLSYHAGIQPGVEASWVGLGWTLNPGAINRTVNGFSDDNLRSKQTIQDYWGGGETNTTERNYNLPLFKGLVNVSYTSVTSNDTYQGFSKNSYYGASVNPLTLASRAISLPNSVVAPANRLLNPRVGASISSQGINAYASVAGLTATTSPVGAIGRINSYTKLLSHKNAFFYSEKKKYTRYWSNTSNDLYTFGSLYAPQADDYIGADTYAQAESEKAYYTSDIYTLYDQDNKQESEPIKQSGGSMPAYDTYSVLGQGTGGRISPYIFENGDLYGQSSYEQVEEGDFTGFVNLDDPIVKYKSSVKFDREKVNFRFVNDFSNKALMVPENIDNSIYERSYKANTYSEGIDYATQHLAGSKHIEWFTNEEIAKGEAANKGFVDYYNDYSKYVEPGRGRQPIWNGERKLSYEVVEDYLQPEMALPKFCGLAYEPLYPSGAFMQDRYPMPGEEGDVITYYANEVDKYEFCVGQSFRGIKPKQYDLSDKIGGFMVTNESGVTYHYGLPVYNYNEYTRTKVKNPEKGAPTFQEKKNPEPYAYTWLLTGITGPDYVDRGERGFNEDDWGYWIKFDYGMWTDSYQWRTPHTEYTSDVSSDVELFSHGIKELYYLDAIETRTHKAFFVKSMRRDGKGVTSRLEGGSKPRRYSIPIKDYSRNEGVLTYSVSPVSTMKLDEIYLYKKSELTPSYFNKERGTKYLEATVDNPHTYTYQGDDIRSLVVGEGDQTVFADGDQLEVKYHNGHLVLDDDDIADFEDQIEANALRVIKINTDYSLQDDNGGRAGVPNSFAHVSDFEGGCNNADFIAPLNLSCVDILGSIIDKDNCYELTFQDTYGTKDFFYGRAKDTYLEVNSTNNSSECNSENDNFSGNYIRYHHLGKLTLNSIKMLGRGGADRMPPTTFNYDKNPRYDPDKYDHWSYYKSDYDDYEENNDASRRTSDESQQNVDAWSLTSVTTPLGAKVKMTYEADDFSQAVLNQKTVLPIQNIVAVESQEEDKVLVLFKEKGLDLSDYYQVDETVDMKYFLIDRVDVGGDILTESNICTNRTEDGGTRGQCTDNIVSDAKVLAINASAYVKDNPSPLASGYPSLLVESSSLHEMVSERIERRRSANRGGEIDVSITPYFVSGFSQAQRKSNGIGGGVRVKSLTIKDTNTGDAYQTVYEYTGPNGQSFGVTAYEPYVLPIIKYPYRDAGDIFNPNPPENQGAVLDIVEGIVSEILGRDYDIRAIEYLGIDIFTDKKSDAYDQDKLEAYRNAFQLIVNESVGDIMTLSSELPAPGVMYEQVTVSELGVNSAALNSTVHRFAVFNREMLAKKELQEANQGDTEYKALLINNRLSSLGSIKSVDTYGSDGSLLETVKYNYLHDIGSIADFQRSIDRRYDNQGVIQQGFNERKLVKQEDDTYVEKAIVTYKSEYPSVLTHMQVTDHKKGTSTSTHNLAFDFYSGQPTEVLTEDSYGNKRITTTTPAYHLYRQMGLKVKNTSNKHMLSQGAETVTYKVNNDFDPQEFPRISYQEEGIVSASVQTWSNQVPMLYGFSEGLVNSWRKHRQYSWTGEQAEMWDDGTAKAEDFIPFKAWSYGTEPEDINWEKQNEITLYDTYSHALEAKDVNQDYAATRMDSEHKLVIATVANAQYREFAYSGAEASNLRSSEGGVNVGNATQYSPQYVHTGRRSLTVPSGQRGFYVNLNRKENRAYRASVWVYVRQETQLSEAELYVTGGTAQSARDTKVKAGAWHLINLDIPASRDKGFVEIGCRNTGSGTIYFDDFRVHPVDAAMTSYVYDPATDELTHILNTDNFYTRFEYDAMGRLTATYQEIQHPAERQISKQKYGYQLNSKDQ